MSASKTYLCVLFSASVLLLTGMAETTVVQKRPHIDFEQCSMNLNTRSPEKNLVTYPDISKRVALPRPDSLYFYAEEVNPRTGHDPLKYRSYEQLLANVWQSRNQNSTNYQESCAEESLRDRGCHEDGLLLQNLLGIDYHRQFAHPNTETAFHEAVRSLEALDSS